jgi:hypothetical protein
MGTSEMRPVKRIEKVKLDPGAMISPYQTPRPAVHPIWSIPGTARGLHIYCERATPSIRQAVEQILDLADPTYDSTQEWALPYVFLHISDGFEGIKEVMASVSSSISAARE